MRPELRTDLIQVAKTVLATVVAWLVAVRLLDLEQAFLAPWAALLTVHATVYRTVWRGAQTVVATGLGLAVSYAAVVLLGYRFDAVPALAAAVLVGLLASRAFLSRDEGLAVATTAIFVITVGAASQEQLLGHRFLDTLVGVTVGLLVNVVVVPPLDDRHAERAVAQVGARMGGLLVTMAGDLRTDVDREVAQRWIEATRDLDDALDRAEGQVSLSRESLWANPLRGRSRRASDPERAGAVLVRLEDGVAQVRALARIVHESDVPVAEWDSEFRRRWTDLLRHVGARVADPTLEARDARGELDRLVRELSGVRLPDLHWPLYGALLTALGNVISIVDDVVG